MRGPPLLGRLSGLRVQDHPESDISSRRDTGQPPVLRAWPSAHERGGCRTATPRPWEEQLGPPPRLHTDRTDLLRSVLRDWPVFRSCRPPIYGHPTAVACLYLYSDASRLRSVPPGRMRSDTSNRRLTGVRCHSPRGPVPQSPEDRGRGRCRTPCQYPFMVPCVAANSVRLRPWRTSAAFS